jgi:hypothetical protein
MLYQIICKSCEGEWTSEEDDAIYCDLCVISGDYKKENK